MNLSYSGNIWYCLFLFLVLILDFHLEQQFNKEKI
jgi:hypothetical protein